MVFGRRRERPRFATLLDVDDSGALAEPAAACTCRGNAAGLTAGRIVARLLEATTTW